MQILADDKGHVWQLSDRLSRHACMFCDGPIYAYYFSNLGWSCTLCLAKRARSLAWWLACVAERNAHEAVAQGKHTQPEGQDGPRLPCFVPEDDGGNDV